MSFVFPLSRLLAVVAVGVLLFPGVVLFPFSADASARFYIDINAPSTPRFKIAIPDFLNLGGEAPKGVFTDPLDSIMSNDLDLSGFFEPMDKGAFLEAPGDAGNLDVTQFKNWSVIGAELLLKGGYHLEGDELEIDVKLYDVFSGRQILGKRMTGRAAGHRYLVHRLAGEIIKLLTGNEGIFQSKLAFVGTATGNKEIYVCDFDGYNPVQITRDKSIALLPRWSPDGGNILFTSYKDGGGPKLYLKEWPGGAVRRISGDAGLNIGAGWAPDGRSIALTRSGKGSPDIYLIDPKGKNIRQLTNHWGIDVSPTFSPDGSRIAFVSNRSGSPQIYVKDLRSGSEERITFEGRYNTSPSWSALDRIAYVSMQDGNFDIFAIDPDGRRLMRLTDGQGNNEDPCWSPDGRYLAFSSNRTGRYQIYMMTANGQNQKRLTSGAGEQTAPSWAP